MKKRRTIIISLLLVAALALGIGYASHTSDITISGTANMDPNPNDFSVVFVEDSAKADPPAFGKASITSINTADFTIGKMSTTATEWMSASGDTVTFTYDVINQSKDKELVAYLNNLFITPGTCRLSTTSQDVEVTEYFNAVKTVYKLDDDGNKGAAMNPGDYLENGEKARIEIVITLKKPLNDGAITWTGVSYKLPFTSFAPAAVDTGSN